MTNNDIAMEEPLAAAAKAGEANEEADNFISRPYQEQMIELALARNTIIFLPTGAGKTYIALQAIKRSSKVLEKPLAAGGKRSVFLTNTVALAKQQAYWIGRITPLRTACYTGDMDLDNWTQERWRDEFERNQVLVATCQIVLDVVRHGYVSLTELNIIVFDECHNATRNHPMTQLMSMYERLPAGTGQRPRIIGMSGTLLGSQVRSATVLADLQRLEVQFDAIITTVESTEQFVNVLVYSTKPAERLRCYEPTVANDTVLKRRISSMVKQFLTVVDKWPLGTKTVTTKTAFRSGQIKLTSTVRSLFNDFLYQMSDLGMYGASLSCMSVLVELELAKRSCDSTVKRQLCRLAITMVERIRHEIVQLWQEAEEMRPDVAVAGHTNPAVTPQPEEANYDDAPIDSAETILTESSKKVLALISFLCEHIRTHPNAAELKCLIFVQRRQTAKILYHVLKNYAAVAPGRFPMRPDFMVGNNTALSESIQSTLENQWNQDVLARFRRNATNLIVATSVLEEGIDLQMCNLVVSFDAPDSYRSYVQSKGRARMANSTYAILVQSDRYAQLVGNLDEFRQVERLLRHYLIGKAIDRPAPLASARAQYFAAAAGVAQVLRTRAGAVLDAVAAVALVNRYCMTLVTDQFCKATVLWQMVGDGCAGNGFSVSMRLPMQATVKETFVSEPCADVIEAKRSAALKACARLYACGELDDHLMPFSGQRIVREVHEQLLQHWQTPKFAADAAENGVRNLRKRTYPIVWPQAVQRCMPQVAGPTNSDVAYLYAIHVQPTDGEPSPTSIDFHAMYSDTKSGFGLMTAREMPPIAAFTLQTAIGAMMISFPATPTRVTLTESGEIEQLRRFHEFLFRDLLNIVHPFLAADHKNREQSYLIVPTRNQAAATIDWPLVHRFQQPLQLHDGDAVAADLAGDLAARKRTKWQFRAEDWLHRVVYPWYRMDTDKRYVVVRVHEHLTPFSAFPIDTFASYAAYIEDKYQLEVTCREQFMLEVQPVVVESGLNALVRAGEQPKAFASRGIELLIPELCQNLAFPGGMWLKATLLPSVLHRMQQLLAAEEMRVELNAQLTVPLATADYQPWPLCEQHNRHPAAHRSPEDIVPVRAIVIPNPEDVGVRQLTTDEFVSISNAVINNACQSQLQPIDFQRHLLDSFPFELDYFYNFINDRMGGIHLGSKKAMKAAGGGDAVSTASTSVAALCDIDDTERQKLRLLAISSGQEQRGLDQSALLIALTAPSAKDIVDHRRDAILGDAVIRLAVALQLMHGHPGWHLGWLRRAHQQLCSGQNLAYCGIVAGVAGRMHAARFEPRDDWQPPLACVPRDVQVAMQKLEVSAHSLFRLQLSAAERESGVVEEATMVAFFESSLRDDYKAAPDDDADDGSGDDTDHANAAGSGTMNRFVGVQRIGDAAVAQTMRALCGVCATAVGLRQAMQVLRYWRILPGIDDAGAGTVDEWLMQPLRVARIEQMPAEARASEAQTLAIDALLVNCGQLEQTLGYRFRDRGWLLQALTHPSCADNAYTDCNQTLAFLGAALCDLLLSAHIAERAEHLAADELADLRRALVSNIAMACYCVRYGMHAHLLSASQALGEKVAAFVTFQEQHGHALNDRVLLLIEETDAKMGEYVDVPAAVGEMFAAVMAAVWMDCGRDLARLWQCLGGLVRSDVERLMWAVPRDVVQRLAEWPGAKPLYERPHVDGDVVMVGVRFTRRSEVVLVHGFGATPREAKVAAAKVALHALMQ